MQRRSSLEKKLSHRWIKRCARKETALLNFNACLLFASIRTSEISALENATRTHPLSRRIRERLINFMLPHRKTRRESRDQNSRSPDKSTVKFILTISPRNLARSQRRARTFGRFIVGIDSVSRGFKLVGTIGDTISSFVIFVLSWSISFVFSFHFFPRNERHVYVFIYTLNTRCINKCNTVYRV